MSTMFSRLAVLVASAVAADVKLATFDGAQQTTASWKLMNDPVMGGSSHSTFDVKDKVGVFNGTCAIVSKLKAPGFAKIEGRRTYADITGYDSIALKVRSSTPWYSGFRIAFGAPGVPKSSIYTPQGSYKRGFQLSGTDWQVVEVPISQFSWDWSPFTGRCNSKDPKSIFNLMKGKQHYCCDRSGQVPSKPDVCVDSKYLSKINSIEVWAEGEEGDFHLEIEWIGASKKDQQAVLV